MIAQTALDIADCFVVGMYISSRGRRVGLLSLRIDRPDRGDEEDWDAPAMDICDDYEARRSVMNVSLETA